MEQIDTLLGRTLAKRPEKSILLTGLRGVGKTVLLNEMERRAARAGYRTIFIEALEGKSLATALVPHLRRLLFDLNRIAGAHDKVRRGLAVLAGFVRAIRISVGDLSLGLDIEPETGSADSGDIEVDLPALLLAIAEAADDKEAAVAILVDEIQYLHPTEIGALIASMHKMQQRQLPLVLLGAGLPVLPGLAGNSKSYAERLFDFPNVGRLAQTDAVRALQGPMLAAGEAFAEDALVEIYAQTNGYPYFLQEWAYQAWNLAPHSPIDVSVVTAATAHAMRRLDENFFRVRYDRLTPRERTYLRAMADLGAGPYRTSDVARRLSKRTSALTPVRAALLGSGMIFSPSHGDLAFTVPLFDVFMRRIIPDLGDIQGA